PPAAAGGASTAPPSRDTGFHADLPLARSNAYRRPSRSPTITSPPSIVTPDRETPSSLWRQRSRRSARFVATIHDPRSLDPSVYTSTSRRPACPTAGVTTGPRLRAIRQTCLPEAV